MTLRHVIAIGRSEHPEWDPQDIWNVHAEDGYWYSGYRRPGLFVGEHLIVRFVPGSQVVGIATLTDGRWEYLPEQQRPEPGLKFRAQVEFPERRVAEGIYMSAFGFSGASLRNGVVGLTNAQARAIEAALANEASA